MLVLQPQAILQRLLHELHFLLVVPVDAIRDDGTHTREAQPLGVAEILPLQAPCRFMVRDGYSASVSCSK